MKMNDSAVDLRVPTHAPRAVAKMMTTLLAHDRPCVTIRACPHASEEGLLQGALLLQQAYQHAGIEPETLCVEAAFACADKLEKVVAYLQTICPRVALRLTFTGILSRPLDLVVAPTTEWFAVEDMGVGLVGAHVFVHFPSTTLTHLRITADCHVTLVGSEVSSGGPGARSASPTVRTASGGWECARGWWECARGWRGREGC